MSDLNVTQPEVMLTPHLLDLLATGHTDTTGSIIVADLDGRMSVPLSCDLDPSTATTFPKLTQFRFLHIAHV